MKRREGQSKVPVVITIAGTDPSGGAGISVDLQVCRDWGCHGMAAITAVVWQNTQGVIGWRPMSDGDLRSQMAAIKADVAPSAIKIGMVPTTKQVQVIRRWLEDVDPDTPVIFDPVMAEGGGEKALVEDGAARDFEALRGVVDLVTPNAMEAQILADVEPSEAIERLLEGGWKRVLLKGGHLEEEQREIRDWLGDESGIQPLKGLPRLEVDCRGTGCQLSTAIACALAIDDADSPRWVEAIEAARSYLQEMLATRCQQVGRGRSIVVRDDLSWRRRGGDIGQ